MNTLLAWCEYKNRTGLRDAKGKRFNIHKPYPFSGGYLVPVFSDYSPRKVIAWFRKAGAGVVEVWSDENGAGVTEFYVEVES